jgi:hypothetical protein
LHEKVGGFTVHAVLHLVSQGSVHVVVAVPSHVAEQVAVKLSGVHCWVQVELTS